MGITVELQQISLEELTKIKNDPERFENLISNTSSNKEETFRDLYLSQGVTSISELLEKFPHLRQNGDAFLAQMEKMLFGATESSENALPASVSLDKAWQVIHFLLSGEVWTGETPLGKILMGGEEIGDESYNTGYGVPRYHNPEAVKKFAETIPDPEELKKNYNPQKIAAAGIYAFKADDPNGEWEYLSYYYEYLLQYFHDAAARGHGILVYSV